MMLALDKVTHSCGHIVTKIVETEFIVGSECHVTLICLPSGIAVRLMLVNAIY